MKIHLPIQLIEGLDSLNANTNYVIRRNANQQAAVSEIPTQIQNIDNAAENTNYLITRNANNQVVINAFTNISNLEDVQTGTNYFLTRNDTDQIIAEESIPEISNLEDITNGNEYVLTRTTNDEVIVEERTPDILGLENVAQGTRYNLTRNANDEVEAEQDTSVQLPIPTTGDLIYGVRRVADDFTLTRIPAMTEFTFFSNNVELNANFRILGENGSRCVHVLNHSCRLVGFGIIHVSTFRTVGLINEDYNFEIITNNVNQAPFTIGLNNSTGTARARSRSIEDLNIFLSAGDCLGLRFVSGNTGDYMQARITVDFNTRSPNANGGFDSVGRLTG